MPAATFWPVKTYTWRTQSDLAGDGRSGGTDQRCAAVARLSERLAADGTGDRLRSLADRLTRAFAPDPERMAAAAAMSHCGTMGS